MGSDSERLGGGAGVGLPSGERQGQAAPPRLHVRGGMRLPISAMVLRNVRYGPTQCPLWA
eukprot:2144711-Rhodomonas_salina.1